MENPNSDTIYVNLNADQKFDLSLNDGISARNALADAIVNPKLLHLKAGDKYEIWWDFQGEIRRLSEDEASLIHSNLTQQITSIQGPVAEALYGHGNGSQDIKLNPNDAQV